MSAQHRSAYGFDEAEPLVCPSCGWAGTAAEGGKRIFQALFDVSCPKCEAMLLIVSHPTVEETKAEAAKGNQQALVDLPHALKIEQRRAEFKRRGLDSPDRLPELEGDALEFIWDFWSDAVEKSTYTVVRLGEGIVWIEPATWEGSWRFDEVKGILKDRYGERFRSLTPTPASVLYLYGDRISGEVTTT